MRPTKEIYVFNHLGVFLRTFNNINEIAKFLDKSVSTLRKVTAEEQLVFGRYYLSYNKKLNPQKIKRIDIPEIGNDEEMIMLLSNESGEWQKLKQSNLYKMLMQK